MRRTDCMLLEFQDGKENSRDRSREGEARAMLKGTGRATPPWRCLRPCHSRLQTTPWRTITQTNAHRNRDGWNFMTLALKLCNRPFDSDSKNDRLGPNKKRARLTLKILLKRWVRSYT